eukprot:gene11812-11956_t
MPYVAATWATWMAGGVAVPLAVTHPPHELDYVIRDAGISAVLTPPAGHDKLKDVTHAAGAVLHLLHDELVESSDSGTTGRPKGALHTHGSLAAMADCLTKAWAWQPSDVILHSLPLHHIHGIVNALYCAHYVGAAVQFLPRFSPAAMWRCLQSGDISVLMAVPTMYSYLLSHYDSHMTPEEQAAARSAAAALRLTVSGSAAAPVPLLQRWKALSGQQLLERYGMTETGMILSNPYEGDRRAGFVGLPLPGVEVKVVPMENDAADSGAGDDDGAGDDNGVVKGTTPAHGPMLFREYWGRPEATAAAFDAEGFFMTGDTVSLEGRPPYYRILGRSSVDIIKSGGYKISALDIESALLHHPEVAEAAVLGVADDKLGQAPLPRNAMGKVNKKELLKTFFSAETAAEKS